MTSTPTCGCSASTGFAHILPGSSSPKIVHAVSCPQVEAGKSEGRQQRHRNIRDVPMRAYVDEEPHPSAFLRGRLERQAGLPRNGCAATIFRRANPSGPCFASRIKIAALRRPSLRFGPDRFAWGARPVRPPSCRRHEGREWRGPTTRRPP